MLKPESRIIGFDDGPFDPHHAGAKVPVVGVVMRGGRYVEGVLKSDVTVDGTDANDVIEGMLLNSRYLIQLKAILLDGISVGGFNVVDIYRLSKKVGIPVISVTRDEPDLNSMFDALRRHFPDGEERAKVIAKGEIVRFSMKTDREDMHLYGKFAGTDYEEALRILNLTTIRGAMPEPIRLAHLIAAAIVKGESRGRP